MVFEGIWTLILLTYAHLVLTSTSIVNCRQLDDRAVSNYIAITLDYIIMCTCSFQLALVYQWDRPLL